MPDLILFYVSGHGYGHARRLTQVMRAVRERDPSTEIRVRTAAAPRLFAPLPPSWIEPSDIDVGVIEHDPMTIDCEATLRKLDATLARRADILADEIAAVRHIRPRLIVADIPFLAGDVAEATGVPCIGISNFTWDWIYATLFAGDSRYARAAGQIEACYAKMAAMLELPFGRTCPTMATKQAMPLITMRSARDPDEVLAQLKISPTDHRPRVLIGTRGGLAAETLAKVSRDASEFLFLCPQDAAAPLPANGVAFQIAPALDFSDVLLISDIVVSKLGYGIVSECIATQTRLVWPPRHGFAEDAVMEKESPRYVPMKQITIEDYHAGRWGNTLRQAMALPSSSESLAGDGAAECARQIAIYSQEVV